MKLTKEQLASLTKEQKLKLASLLEEKQRRKLSQKERYKQNSIQQRVHASTAGERYVFTGNGSGKTCLLTHELHWAATGFNPVTNTSTPVPAKICLILDNPDGIEDILIEYRKWYEIKAEQLHKRGRHAVNFITFDNGSTITVLTHDVNPLKLEGSEWDYIFCNEPPPRPVFMSVYRGGRRKGRKLRALLVGTPITAAWMRTEVYEPWIRGELPDIECFRGSSYENKDNLATGFLDKFSARLSEKERAIRLEGEFFDLDGLALAHLFKENIHILRRADYAFNPEHPAVVVIDCHPSKPSYAALIGADEVGPVWVKEMKAKLSARQFARVLKGWYAGYRVVDIVCDDLGSAEGTGGEGFKSFIQILQEEGVRARPTTYADKHDEQWVTRIQDALLVPEEADEWGRRLPKLRVMEGNFGIVSDIRNVQWQKYKDIDAHKPTLEISNKDWLSCLKYGLACNIHINKHKHRSYHVNKSAYGFAMAPKQLPKALRLLTKYR